MHIKRLRITDLNNWKVSLEEEELRYIWKNWRRIKEVRLPLPISYDLSKGWGRVMSAVCKTVGGAWLGTRKFNLRIAFLWSFPDSRMSSFTCRLESFSCKWITSWLYLQIWPRPAASRPNQMLWWAYLEWPLDHPSSESPFSSKGLVK